MTTYDYERLWFEEITTEGSFPRGSIAMEVVFEDDTGSRYVWTPKWNEMQNMYAAAERVEEVNEGGGEELKRLKELQRFTGPTITRLAKCIDQYKSLRAVKQKLAGNPVVGVASTEHTDVADIFHDADVSPPEYPNQFTLSDRWSFIRDRLHELNQDDYQYIIRIIEVLVHRNRHIDAEERRRTIIEELNKVLTYENMEIGLDGKVQLRRDNVDG